MKFFVQRMTGSNVTQTGKMMSVLQNHEQAQLFFMQLF
jgi:hypothetical protein